MRNNGLSFFTILLIALPLLLSAQEKTLVNFEDLYPERLEIAGFTLPSAQEITIDANAITPFRSRRAPLLADAWIIKSKTREIVWELTEADDVERERGISTFSDKVNLEAGNYEVYYSTFPNFGDSWDGNGRRGGFWNSMFGDVFYGDDWDVRRRDYRELHFRLTGNGTPASEEEVSGWQEALKAKALINYTALRDDRFEEKVLQISRPVSMKIYALGEARHDGEFDFGWIINLKNREKVWDLTYRHSIHAGGASKNRVAESKITLEPGTYKVVYVTDDSHSYNRWNSAPPYDPAFWGLSIWLDNDTDKSAIAFVDAAEYEEKNVIVEFERVRDNDYHVKGFSLKKPLSLHIYALGEGSDGEMYDYGWIVNTKTREKVWMMDYYDTEHGGGASKNRLFDGTIDLKPGNYMAYYVSDGSHSYHDWNSGRPYNEKKWGMTISVLNDDFKPSDVAEYNEEDDKSVLVRINRVGDYDRARARFTLDKDQSVHIYAIGEGLDRRMYDYAWIENAKTGIIAWEMTYRQTESAGGARKNRMFDGNISLKKGEYVVYYESDDSHSFNDWNDNPPYDPVNWGITITRTED